MRIKLDRPTLIWLYLLLIINSVFAILMASSFKKLIDHITEL